MPTGSRPSSATSRWPSRPTSPTPQLATAAERVHTSLGPVDLLVNSAGVVLPAPLAEGRADEWRRIPTP